jgi:AraC-like DNA-binding protein
MEIDMKNNNEKHKNYVEANKIYVLPSKLIEDVKEHPLAASLYFSDIGCFENAKNHYRERRNGCEQAILIYCFKGSGYCILDGQKKIIEKDNLLLIPENTPHIYASSEENPWSILWIHLKGSNLKSFFNYSENSIPLYEVPMEKQRKIKHLFEDIFEALEKGFNFENLIYSFQVLNNILGFFFFYPSFNKLNIKDEGVSIDESIKYMLKSLDLNLTLEELSLNSKLSPSHYSYLFKKHTGFSPINYFLRLKVQRACVYLDMSEYRINEICEFLGFKDPFYFSRIFHKVMGMSPSEYRKKQKG